MNKYVVGGALALGSYFAIKKIVSTVRNEQEMRVIKEQINAWLLKHKVPEPPPLPLYTLPKVDMMALEARGAQLQASLDEMRQSLSKQRAESDARIQTILSRSGNQLKIIGV